MGDSYPSITYVSNRANTFVHYAAIAVREAAERASQSKFDALYCVSVNYYRRLFNQL